MNFKKTLQLTTATVMATSAIVAVAPANADAATKVEASISKAEKQMQKAYKTYYNAKGVASLSSVKKELSLAKKYYNDAKKEIAKTSGSKKKAYTAKLDKSKKYITRTEGYVKGLEYAQSLESKAKKLESAVIKGQKSKVVSDYATFEKELKNAEKKIKGLVYGKSVEAKLMKKHLTPTQTIGNAVKVYVAYAKAETLLNTPAKAQKEIAGVAKELSKVSKKSNLGQKVRAYVKSINSKYNKVVKTAPVLNYEGKTNIVLNEGTEFVLPKVTATDNIDKKVTVNHVISGPNGATSVDTNVLGEYTVTYTATDSHGNKSLPLVITVTVREYQNLELTLMHTNDTHAHVESIPRRITAIKQIREQKPDSLLLDAGDVFSGTLYFNEYKGQADLEFMNMIGYDAMVFGNHEFDLGTEPLAAFVKNAKFPFVSANVDFSKDVHLKDRYNDEITITASNGQIYNGIVKSFYGEKVGIFGLTTAETSTISSPGDDVEFKYYIEAAQKAVTDFEAMGVNKIIALTHIGYLDGGGDNDMTLAKEVEGIDVIIGGHSHDNLTEPVVDTSGAEPTVIVQANEYGKVLGVLDVEFDREGKVIKHNGQLIDLLKKENDQFVYAEDAEALAILNTKYKPAIDRIKQTVVGQTSVLLDGARANVRTQETNLGNLITDGMLAKAKTINPKTVIALQNGGGIRESIPAGDITMSHILTVMPFGNALAIMELTGAEIKTALERSVSEAPNQSGAFLHVAGMKFTYDSSKTAGTRVVDVQVKENGSFVALDPAKKYFVATNTFTAKGGDNYEVFGKAYKEGRVSEPGNVDWEIFRDFIVANPTHVPAVEGRIVDVKQ